MIDSSLVVASAASSFNNAALVAPSFLWNAVLMLPLFALVWFYGADALARWKYTAWLVSAKNRMFNFALVTEVVLILWLVVMHGNFMALREATSNLPFVIAAVLFGLVMSVVQKIKQMNIPNPQLPADMKYKKLVKILIGAALLAVIGFSGMPTWWGFLLQSAAVVCGALVGRTRRKIINPIAFTTVIIFILTIAVLMQPEFFRFGQLGVLTVWHMLAILLLGVAAVVIIAVRNVNARGRIHHSAFVKLKWLARFMTALCLFLFVLTESVPVFLGLVGVFAVGVAMSVWHEKSVPENLTKHLWAILLGAFGVVIGLPLITAVGILYWQTLPAFRIRQLKFVL